MRRPPGRRRAGRAASQPGAPLILTHMPRLLGSETAMPQPILALAAEWATFEAALGGSATDTDMKTAFRRAFCAGALTILHIQTYPGRSGAKEPSEAEMAARMEVVSEELKQVIVETGRAGA
jgi:hypothetical protein